LSATNRSIERAFSASRAAARERCGSESWPTKRSSPESVQTILHHVGEPLRELLDFLALPAPFPLETRDGERPEV
jgi:hypothetical protein